MQRILVIADDLSGAAEIAGIGRRFGLRTRIHRDQVSRCDADLTVIDTDSRSYDPERARNTVHQAIAGLDASQFDLIYKKTDSAMRGQMLGEILEVMRTFRLPDALLVPHNPSRGRKIIGGKYLIDDTPLDQTSFASDPEYPATTSDVVRLLMRDFDHPVSVLKAGSTQGLSGIVIGEASNLGEVDIWTRRVDGETLAVGGADFFGAILCARGLTADRPFITKVDGSRLFVCGSASAYSRELIEIATKSGVCVSSMPDDVFAGAEPGGWATTIAETLATHPAVLVAINRPVDHRPEASGRLQSILSDVAAQVLEKSSIEQLLLEGGATASAVCRRMHWSEFEILGELDTGVVQMRVSGANQQKIIVKPGSYPWPDVVWKM